MKPTLLFVLIVLNACESGPPRALDPVWGKQPCGHCAMLVSEKAPSAQALLSDGARIYFDDVGCMAAWVARERQEPRAMWAHAREDAWIDVHEAHFSTGNTTPMDFGYLAAGAGLTWNEVRAGVAGKTRRHEGETP